jgi:hypothetical protein
MSTRSNKERSQQAVVDTEQLCNASTTVSTNGSKVPDVSRTNWQRGILETSRPSERYRNAQRKYSSYDRELLAIYEAVKHFRHMLEARHFVIWVSRQYPIRIPRLLNSCYMPCPSHPPWLDHSNYYWRGVQVTKIISM